MDRGCLEKGGILFVEGDEGRGGWGGRRVLGGKMVKSEGWVDKEY